MKLIHQLERKLSWRKKKASNYQDRYSGNKSKKFNKSSKNVGSTVKVTDTEFSGYIPFSDQVLKFDSAAIDSICYEFVSIRPREKFQSNQCQNIEMCPDRFSSPSRKDELDIHIYDNIQPVECDKFYNNPKMSSNYNQKNDLKQSESKYGSTTVTSVCRRNRIKTNPWCHSPWTTKAAFHHNDKCLRLIKPANFNLSDNDYECIDWEDIKENLDTASMISSNNNILHVPYLQQQTINRHASTKSMFNFDSCKSPRLGRLKPCAKLRTSNHYDPYPRSTLIQSNADDTADYLAQAPSPEFVSQSQQLCNEISSYFQSCQSEAKLSHEKSNKRHEEDLEKLTNYDCISQNSFVTIDLGPADETINEELLSDWSIDHDGSNHSEGLEFRHSDIGENKSTFFSSSFHNIRPYAAESPSIDNQKPLEHSSKALKRKRPISTHSIKQSKKLDRLKTELKEIVHTAILEAKKEHNKQL